MYVMVIRHVDEEGREYPNVYPGVFHTQKDADDFVVEVVWDLTKKEHTEAKAKGTGWEVHTEGRLTHKFDICKLGR
tara:strand:+ start:22142 stop:22369 length:228 start_codon:yes stop_codon:yes gene_type:complete